MVLSPPCTGRRIAASALSGQPTPQSTRVASDEGTVTKPQTQERRAEARPAEPKLLRHQIIEASHKLQRVGAVFKKERIAKNKKKKDVKMLHHGANAGTARLNVFDHKIKPDGAGEGKGEIVLSKREKLRNLITSMFGPAPTTKRR
jgi:hypothetical protein